MGNQFNINSGWGMATVAGLAGAYPTTGKVFVVAKTAQTGRQILQDMFNVDPDGVNRYGTTLNTVAGYCTANRGDVVYMAPGHTETISTATAITLSIAGVRVVGLGHGAMRPTITLDTGTDATINITANSIRFENCIFVANFAAIVSCFTLTTATDFQLINCEFRDTASNLNFIKIVDTDATSNHADGLRIEGCRRTGAGATANTSIVKMDGTNDRLYIKNNYFAHAATTAAGLMIIAAGKVVTNAEIENNVCNFIQATNLTTGLLITTDGSTNSGFIRRNLLQTLDDTTPILVTAASGFIFDDNKVASNADTSGYLRPALDT